MCFLCLAKKYNLSLADRERIFGAFIVYLHINISTEVMGKSINQVIQELKSQ